MKRKASDIVVLVIIAICFIVFVICGISAYSQYSEYKKGKEEYENLDANITTTDSVIEESAELMTFDFDGLEESNDEEPILEPIKLTYPALDIDFEAYKNINSDFVGIVYIPVLDARYPIAKSKDNAEYLVRTFEGKNNGNGCIFMDKYSAADFSDVNTFLFGHNMKNGTMFGCLREFRYEPDLCHKDPYIYIYTENGVYKYHIFAYYLTTPDSLTYKDIVDRDGYKQYVDHALLVSEYSQYDSSLDNFDKYPRLLTLSTCSGNNHTHYMIVNAVCLGKCTAIQD